MQPTFDDGDIVMIDTGSKMIYHDCIYAFAQDNFFILVKRIRVGQGGKLSIMSDSSGEPPIMADRKEIDILGRVIWFSRKL